MNWEAFGAIGEIIGAAAVVGSLVYLAVQIQSQNRESRMSSMHDISAGYRNSLAMMGERDTAVHNRQILTPGLAHARCSDVDRGRRYGPTTPLPFVLKTRGCQTATAGPVRFRCSKS